MTTKTGRLTAVAALSAVLAFPAMAQAQDYRTGERGPGVILSNREREVAYPVRLPDGRVVQRAGSDGIAWLFGIGGVYGKASALPLVNGATPSIMRSTPSGGIVPGQNPR
ncbi:hypothetical protein [Jiella mangrovi]|uniref:Uncharacterized protein n=1 Tax=Jiella mangrovi TaxID=2821407 RepID=A0ABS4BBP7_9HYPH|nr:hypothetical protein [Jiella mangrovi]MBP0614175.1 hypothetical protein [Jiella mangrovi]